MRSRMGTALLTVASLVLATVLAGCAGSSWQFWKKSSSTETRSEPAVATTAPAPAPAPSVATAMPVSAASAPSADFIEHPELGDVRFRPGFVTIGKADAPALDAVVRWLKENPGALVKIEGHSDDLGTPAANVSVGEKRAVSVMNYLVSKGLEPGRISIVSYGSDRPVCTEKTSACRAQNRRAHFVVKRP
jgi:peptidoglycan-associated lipoprotein